MVRCLSVDEEPVSGRGKVIHWSLQTQEEAQQKSFTSHFFPSSSSHTAIACEWVNEQVNNNEQSWTDKQLSAWSDVRRYIHACAEFKLVQIISAFYKKKSYSAHCHGNINNLWILGGGVLHDFNVCQDFFPFKFPFHICFVQNLKTLWKIIKKIETRSTKNLGKVRVIASEDDELFVITKISCRRTR